MAVAVCVILVLLLPLVAMYLRRRWLTGQGGLFDCALRTGASPEAADWTLGLAKFRPQRLEWYRVFSLSLRPSKSFPRRNTRFVQHRPAQSDEAMALFDGSRIVTLVDRATGIETRLAMDSESVMALMAWLESAPPGSHYVPSSADPYR